MNKWTDGIKRMHINSENEGLGEWFEGMQEGKEGRKQEIKRLKENQKIKNERMNE